MQYLNVFFLCYDPSCYGELISTLAERDSVCTPHPYVSDFRKKFTVRIVFYSEYKFSLHYEFNESIDFLFGYRIARNLLCNVRKLSNGKCRFRHVWSK